MPIKRYSGEKPVATRWTHEIIAQRFTARMYVKNGRVETAEPVIHWTINHRFDKVRETCSQRGHELYELDAKGVRKEKNP